MNRNFIVPVLLFLSLLIVPSVLSVGLLDGLGEHFDFDEGTGNSSIGDIDEINLSIRVATGHSPAGEWTTGIIGSAINLDGGDRYEADEDVNITSMQGIISPQDYSISVWIYPEVYDSYTAIYSRNDVGGYTQVLTYEAGYLRNVVAGGGRTNCSISYIPPVLTNEWTHIVAAVEDASTTFYINGEESYTEYEPAVSGRCNPTSFGQNNYVGIGGVPLISTNSFNGSIDELSYWSSRTLNSSDVESLYNNGNGLSFESYSLALPEQIANFADIDMDSNDVYSLYFDSFFSNYEDITVSFVDEIQGANAYLTLNRNDNVTQTYNTAHLVVQLTPLGELFDNNVRMRIFSNETQFDTILSIVASNALGNVLDSVSLSVNGDTAETITNPNQIASIATPITLPYSSNYEWSMNNYFTGYDGLRVNFDDNFNGVSVELSVEKGDAQTSYNISQYKVFVTPEEDNIRLKVYSNETTTNLVMTLSTFYQIANNSYNTLQNPLTVKIQQFGSVPTVPPTQIASLDTVYLEQGDTYTFKFKDYAQDYTGAGLYYEDESAGATIYSTSGDSYQQGNYTVTINGELVQITAVSSSYTQDFTLFYVNQAGELEIPFTVVIGSIDLGGTTQSSSSFRSLISWFMSLFPEASTLPLSTRMGFVLITILLFAGLLMGVAINAGGDAPEAIAKYVLPPVIFLIVIFFTALKYVPISITVMLVLLSGGILYILLGGNSGS